VTPANGRYRAGPPERDPRFHAVTLVVAATVSEPGGTRVNPVEIRDVKLFAETELPADITQGMEDLLQNARSKKVVWE
jgi:8-oxo-dGTP diphosphatase